MSTTSQSIPLRSPSTTTAPLRASRRPLSHVLILLGLWLAIFVAALSTPPLLDDADATHAQAAQAMLTTGDWVTLHVDGIRYLEKPPLPYWLTAISLRLFAPKPPYAHSQAAESRAAFAVHLPLALTILGLALLGYAWARRAFNPTTALYTAIFLLTSTGVFLFTRVFIPDALLSLLLAFALYAFLRSLDPPTNAGAPSIRGSIADGWDSQNIWPYAIWTSLALAVLTKGLVALVFFFGTTLIFLIWTNQLHLWRRLRPVTGILLFLAIAAPWHILAGLRNTGGANGHGFFWFYFINEHVLRFLGRRIPRDYNKLPVYLYWSLHLVWLFPWSLFAPAALLYAWRNRRVLSRAPSGQESVILSEGALGSIACTAVEGPRGTSSRLHPSTLSNHDTPAVAASPTFRTQTIQILLIFSTLVLVFFSISTNQEYYTFPVYLPLLMLLAAAITAIQSDQPVYPRLSTLYTLSFAAYTTLGLAIAAALAYGLWSARHLHFVPDIGDLLAHRNVGDYTLSMSHFFDLTGPSFAALRLPATLALLAFLIGPATAWFLHTRRCAQSAMLTIALTSTVFLVAAHIALVRFSPMLSSANFAQTIQSLEDTHHISPSNEVLLYGDQAYGSSIPFYLNRRVLLVDGRSTSMLFGSTFPDAPHIFLTPANLQAQWGTGPRKLLFVPLERREVVDKLLGPRQIILQQTSGKVLITDRPLASQEPSP
jgi:4-amino-4-deoxy-L-arabinose transferase-like glycosyltransferase